MRILAIAESFFGDHRNGLARVAWDVARAMAERGHDVQFLCPASGVTAIETCWMDGVALTRYPRPRVSAFNPRNPRVHIDGYARAIRDVSHGRSWDVVHCHGIYGMNAAADVFGGGVPKVLTIHSPALLEQAWNWTHGTVGEWAKLLGLPFIHYHERRAIAVSTVCHSLSFYTRDRVERLYSAARDKPWDVIPHWIDAAWWRTMTKSEARNLLGWPLDTGIVLTVRQLKPRYGIDLAIRALTPLLLKEDCQFRIVGDGPERGALVSQAGAAGVAKSVVFEGAVPEDRLRLAYQAADAFVIPSRALECFGLIAQEAMAAGLPTVGTRVGALPEILGPASPERLVCSGDDTALRGAIATILSQRSSEIAEKRGEMLVSYVKQRYAEEGILTRYERLFCRAVSQN